MKQGKRISALLLASSLLLTGCGKEENPEDTATSSGDSISSSFSSSDISGISDKKAKINILRRDLLKEERRTTKGYKLKQNPYGEHFLDADLLLGNADQTVPVSLYLDVDDEITSMSYGEGEDYEAYFACSYLTTALSFGGVPFVSSKKQSPTFYVQGSDVYSDFSKATGMLNAINTGLSAISKLISDEEEEQEAFELPEKSKISFDWSETDYEIPDVGDIDIGESLIEALAAIMEEDAESDAPLLKYVDNGNSYSISYSPTKATIKNALVSFLDDHFEVGVEAKTFIEALFLVIPEDRDYYRSDFKFDFDDDTLLSLSVDFRLKVDPASYDSVPMINDYTEDEVFGGAKIGLGGYEMSFKYEPIPESEVEFTFPDDLADYEEITLDFSEI